MAGQYTGTQRTYILEDSEGVKFTGMTYGATEGYVKKSTADNDPFVGVIVNDERLSDALSAAGDQTGRSIALQVDGYGSIWTSEALSYGDRLILTTDGKVKKLPAVAGTYNVIGEAQKAADANTVVPFKIALMSVTV